MTIKEALEYGVKTIKENEIEEPITKAKLLLAFAISKNKEYLISHDLEVMRRRNNK